MYGKRDPFVQTVYYAYDHRITRMRIAHMPSRRLQCRGGTEGGAS